MKPAPTKPTTVLSRSPRRSPAAALVPLFSLVVAGAASGCSRASGSLPADEPASTPTVSSSVVRVAAAPAAVADLESAFKRAIHAVGPAVVSVYSTRTIHATSPFGGESGSPLDFFFRGPPMGDRELQQQGLGSGFLVSADGLVVTNNHVVEQAEEIKVKTSDGRELPAKVVGTDPPTDLALLRIDAGGKPLPYAELGSSAAIEVGDWVLAIGNPFGLPRTVSAGIVSAVGRADVGILDFEDFIQTDAAVNLGNSGGPLVDLDGRVIGINTAIASTSGGSIGIAFAIPVDMAKDVIRQLREKGKVVRGHLGVMISEIDEDLAQSFGYSGKGGILVQDVTDGGPAQKAGVRAGDIIETMDGKDVGTISAFRSAVAAHSPGASLELRVWRNGSTRKMSVTLGEAPRADAVASVGAGGKPRLGIGLADVTPELRSQLGLEGDARVVISDVLPGSPAANAGLRPGDVLESIDGKPVESAGKAIDELRDANEKKGVRLRIVRDGVGRFVVVHPK